MLQALNERYSKIAVSEARRLGLYEKIADLVANNVPLIQAIDELWRRASRDGEKPDAPEAVALDSWRSKMKNGQTLSSAMTGWAQPTEIMLIAAGETSGHVDEGLMRAVVVAQGQREMRGALIGGVMYPAILLLLSVGLVWMFGTEVIPQFALIVPVERWEGTAAHMAVLSTFAQHGTIPFLTVICGLVVLYMVTLARWTGRVRSKVDAIPPWSLYRLFVGGSFMLSAAALVAAGVSVDKALRQLSEAAGPWLRERIDTALYYVEQGLNLGEALDASGYGFPDREIIDDLMIYANLGSFDKALERIGEKWLEKGNKRIKAAARILNVAAMLMLGGLVAWIAIGLFAIQSQVTSSLGA